MRTPKKAPSNITDISLYIHIPWCIQKCPYCDFNSHKAPAQLTEDLYIKALIDDLAANHALLDKRIIKTIFIGGGTPSLISSTSYQKLFNYLSQHHHLAKDIEITLEANPGTIDYTKFQSYRDIGINRLSIGIQSFNDEQLKRLGRIHSSQNAQMAIELALKAGFDNFNLDLMHGLPKQTPKQAQQDLTTALSFEPPHLSWYQLTIEPNTIFYSQKPVLPNENILLEIESEGYQQLSHYQHYEISAFCQANKQCQHNLNYWQFGDYLGIGAGAHSKISDNKAIFRFEKKRMPKDYMAMPSENINYRSISEQALAFEFMLMNSRLKQPIDKTLFETRTTLNIEAIRPQLDRAHFLQLIEEKDDAITITEHGYRYLNEFQELFL